MANKNKGIPLIENTKKSSILNQVFLVLDAKGKAVISSLQGYGPSWITVLSLGKVKKSRLCREEIDAQSLTLYVNPKDENDVILVSKSFKNELKAWGEKTYSERREEYKKS